jgi:hypothetical protein
VTADGGPGHAAIGPPVDRTGGAMSGPGWSPGSGPGETGRTCCQVVVQWAHQRIDAAAGAADQRRSEPGQGTGGSSPCDSRPRRSSRWTG